MGGCDHQDRGAELEKAEEVRIVTGVKSMPSEPDHRAPSS